MRIKYTSKSLLLPGENHGRTGVCLLEDSRYEKSVLSDSLKL